MVTNMKRNVSYSPQASLMGPLDGTKYDMTESYKGSGYITVASLASSIQLLHCTWYVLLITLRSNQFVDLPAIFLMAYTLYSRV